MTSTDIIIRTYQNSDEQQIIELWNKCNLLVPQNNPKYDIQLKMAFQPDLFLVGILDNRVVASAMAGYDGHRGWVNYLAVDPDTQNNGFGRKIMAVAEEKLINLGCPKINIQIRSTNKKVLEFYERIGFSDDNVLGMGKRLKK